MSYSRFIDSDVYVFFSVNNELECCGCILQEREWEPDDRAFFGGYLRAVGEHVQDRFRTTQGMVEHLALHRAAGHDVPEDLEARLWADDERNFGTA